MSNVRGKISIDVQFADSTSSAGVQSLKTVTLQEATEYTSGKVAIVTGTVGTATAILWNTNNSPPVGFGGYKNAAGSEVSMSSVQRVLLRSPSSQGVIVEDGDVESARLFSANNEVAVGSNLGLFLEIRARDGTASFTAVLYGT